MTGFKITDIYVYVSTEDDGTEGVPAFYGDGIWHPLIAADDRRLAICNKIANEIAANTNRPIEMRRYSSYEVINTIGQK